MGTAHYSLDPPIALACFQRANILIGRGKKILQIIYFARVLISHKGPNPTYLSRAIRFQISLEGLIISNSSITALRLLLRIMPPSKKPHSALWILFPEKVITGNKHEDLQHIELHVPLLWSSLTPCKSTPLFPHDKQKTFYLQ